MVEALYRLMNNPENATGPVNFGNPREMSVMELAEIIKELSNSKSEFIFKPLPKNDPTRRQPNIEAAKNLLNWEPTVALEDGLGKTIEYFDALLKEKSVKFLK